MSYVTCVCSTRCCAILQQVKNILKQGGGMREFYLNELVTHIITESAPDPATLPISDVTVVKVGQLNLYSMSES